MKTTLYLIRHGQSLGNVQRRFLGHTDWDLTELGYRQAARTAVLFQEMPVDVVVSSDLVRAMHTVLPIAESHRLPLLLDPGIPGDLRRRLGRPYF